MFQLRKADEIKFIKVAPTKVKSAPSKLAPKAMPRIRQAVGAEGEEKVKGVGEEEEGEKNVGEKEEDVGEKEVDEKGQEAAIKMDEAAIKAEAPAVEEPAVEAESAAAVDKRPAAEEWPPPNSKRARLMMTRWTQGMWTLDECLAAGYTKREYYGQAYLDDLSSTEETVPEEEEEEVQVDDQEEDGDDEHGHGGGDGHDDGHDDGRDHDGRDDGGDRHTHEIDVDSSWQDFSDEVKGGHGYGMGSVAKGNTKPGRGEKGGGKGKKGDGGGQKGKGKKGGGKIGGGKIGGGKSGGGKKGGEMKGGGKKGGEKKGGGKKGGGKKGVGFAPKPPWASRTGAWKPAGFSMDGREDGWGGHYVPGGYVDHTGQFYPLLAMIMILMCKFLFGFDLKLLLFFMQL